MACKSRPSRHRAAVECHVTHVIQASGQTFTDGLLDIDNNWLFQNNFVLQFTPVCDYNNYRQIINLQTPGKISSVPVCFFRLVTLCQCLKICYDFWRFINVSMYVCTPQHCTPTNNVYTEHHSLDNHLPIEQQLHF